MKKQKCEICMEEGTFKTKTGNISSLLMVIPPYPEHIDLRATNSFHWRCWKCRELKC